MQIIPGVYLVNGFPYGQHQNSYVVKIDDVSMMFDCGDLERDTYEVIRTNCRTWGIEMSDLSYLLVTHAHLDHSSHAAKLQRMGVKIIASEDTAEAMACGDDRCIGYAVHRQYEPCKVNLIANDGNTLTIGKMRIRYIAAPGHTKGSMIYEVVFNAQKLWFVGDVILPGNECQSVSFGWSGGPDYDKFLYLKTLRKLSHLKCDCLFPGHHQPCIGGGRRIIEMAYTKAMIEWR